MDNEPQHNPIGNEHPLRGCMIGVALAAALAAIVVGFCYLSVGCTTELRPALTIFVTNAVQRVLVERPDAAASDEGDPAGTKPGRQDSERLVFRYGGFQGGNAEEDPATQIADLHMSRNGMSYRWAKGGCENFGAKDRGDCDHTLACAFYWDESAGAWIGGKFDWISTSRTTRDWKNIFPGQDGKAYHGWQSDLFFAASKRAFCIVRKDGKIRTNLIETEDPK